MYGFAFAPFDDCCKDFRDKVMLFAATGDLNEETSDHLDACPVCTRAVDLYRALKMKP